MNYEDFVERISGKIKDDFNIKVVPLRTRRNFSDYYKHSESLVKLEGWSMDEGFYLEGNNSYRFGFFKYDNIDRTDPSDFEIDISGLDLIKTGFDEGKAVNELTCFLDLSDEKNIDLYIGKAKTRQLSKKEERNIEKELRGF